MTDENILGQEVLEQEQPEVDEQPAEQEQVAEEQDNSVEEKARLMGWKPESEYKGPEGGFVPADEFVKRGEEELPVLKQNLRVALDKISKMEKDYTQLSSMWKTREAKDYENEYKGLKAAIQNAIETGDIDRLPALMENMDELNDRAKNDDMLRDKEGKTADDNDVPQAVSDWTVKNPWFYTDPQMQSFAISQFGAFQRMYPSLSTEQLLEMVENETISRFPERINKPATRKPAHVESGKRTVGKKGLSFGDLSPSDQARARRFIKDGTFKDETEYMQAFIEANGSDYKR